MRFYMPKQNVNASAGGGASSAPGSGGAGVSHAAAALGTAAPAAYSGSAAAQAVTPPAAAITNSVSRPAPPALSSLRPLFHRPNWTAKKLAHYMLPGRAGEMDWFAARLAEALHAAYPGQLAIGWANEVPVQAARMRPLRVLRVLQPGHVVCTDVHFYAHGSNLGVRFFSRPRTRIFWYRIAMHGVLFGTLFVLGYAAYLGQTDQLSMLARDYARKLAVDDNADILFQRLRFGSGVKPAWSYLDYFREDAGQFLLDLGKVPAMLAAGIGVVLRLLPPDPLRILCSLLGSPRSEEFTEQAQAHDAAVDAELDGVLFSHAARITEKDKHYIEKGEC